MMANVWYNSSTISTENDFIKKKSRPTEVFGMQLINIIIYVL